MQTSSVDAKVRLFLSCARVWGDKLCKAIEKSINLFNCFSEPQPILCKSDDLMGVFNSQWMFGDKNVAFTNQSVNHRGRHFDPLVCSESVA